MNDDLVGFVFFWLFVSVGAAIVFFTVFVFTKLEEGTDKIVLKVGAFHKILLAKVGFTTDAEGFIVPGREWHILGGFRFVGIRGIHSIFKKDKFEWIKSKPGGKLDETMEKKVDRNVSKLLARYYVYGLVARDKEDKELAPITVWLAITAWIVNPKKAWLDTEDWFSAFIGRIEPYVRHYVSLHTYEEIIKHPDCRIDVDVFKMLKEEGIIKELRELHGVEVHAIECADIAPAEDIRESTLKKWRAEREAQSRLASTSGAIMSMIAQQTGLELKDVQSQFKDDPSAALEKYKGLIEINRDFVTLQMGLDAGAVRMHNFKGGQGGLDLIALLGDVFSGRNNGVSQGGSPAPTPAAPPAPPRRGSTAQGPQGPQGN